MEIFDNGIPVFGEADDRTLNQIRVCARTADKVALMPDNHLGYGVPIGGVVAYRDAISPTGVGFDIGCGNKAVRVDMPGSELRSPAICGYASFRIRRLAAVEVARSQS
jgi:tRNA-splicing ligase RtcB